MFSVSSQLKLVIEDTTCTNSTPPMDEDATSVRHTYVKTL